MAADCVPENRPSICTTNLPSCLILHAGRLVGDGSGGVHEEVGGEQDKRKMPLPTLDLLCREAQSPWTT